MKLKHVEYGVVIPSEMDVAATSHPIDCDENTSRDELIENYFHMGFYSRFKTVKKNTERKKPVSAEIQG